MTRFSPASLDELQEAVATALAAEEPLEIVAGGSKRGLGRPLQTPHVLDLNRLSGVREYQPSELVLTAGAATPLDEIEALLDENRQMLAFEPPDWRALLGAGGTRPTLGGTLACNLAGSRRVKAGAARDHFLGFRGVSGRGEIFKAGGKVVKNVTGYDLCKLMAGSYGTLAVLEEVSVKVLPHPEAVATVLFRDITPALATATMAAVLGSPHEVSGAAYIPAGLALPIGVAVRVEGPAPSVVHRRDALIREFGDAGAVEVLDDAASIALWRSVGAATPLAGFDGRAVWRVSVAPSRGAGLAETVARRVDAAWFLDWGGGLVWLAVPEADDGGAAVIRAAVGGDGHATLVKGSSGLRRQVPVFEPQPASLATLTRRVKEGFDPRHILNPGRMVDGV